MKSDNLSESGNVWDPSRRTVAGAILTRMETFGKIWRGYASKSVLIAVLTFAALMTSAHAQQVAAQSQERAPPDDTWLKWVILAFALAGVLPLAAWLRRYPSIAPKLWTLMGMLPFAQAAIPHLNIALVSWADWPGYVKGAEFSALDLLTLALFLALPRARDPLPFRWPMALYFVAVLLSAFQAVEPVAALFYPWQLARMFLLYVVVTRSCADKRFIPALLTGMAISLCFEALVVIWQRFALGATADDRHLFAPEQPWRSNAPCGHSLFGTSASTIAEIASHIDRNCWGNHCCSDCLTCHNWACRSWMCCALYTIGPATTDKMEGCAGIDRCHRACNGCSSGSDVS